MVASPPAVMRQPGVGGRVAQHLLEQLGHEQGRAEEDHARDHHEEAGDTEVLRPNIEIGTIGSFAGQLPEHEAAISADRRDRRGA